MTATPPLDTTCEILRDLIAFPTVSDRSNLAIIDYLADRLAAAGAQIEITHDATGQKANLFATLGPRDTSGGLMLSGHTDVVPAPPEGWTSDPFTLTERGTRLYGRGTCDMKGFVAACVALAPRFAGRITNKPLHFAFTYDEEVGCFGARALAQHLSGRDLIPATCIVGEPTEGKIIEGHKGCFEYTTRVRGLAGHGSNPDEGVNAAEVAARIVAQLHALKAPLKARAPSTSPFIPPWTTINTGVIRAGSARNVIADMAEIDWEMRPVQPADAEYVKDTLAHLVEELLAEMRTVCSDASIETEVIGEVAGLEPVPHNRMRDTLLRLTGQNGAEVVPFGTEAGLFQEIGTHTVLCGPGSIEQAHIIDEFIEIAELEHCLDLLTAVVADHTGA